MASDRAFVPPVIPAHEPRRLQALRDLEVLDTDPQPELDALVRVASAVCGVPMALISLVDADRQWFKAKVGLDATETPREVSFCGHAILEDDVFEVPDATADPRFAGNPLVTAAPDIRFYAGMPIKLSSGDNIGTLCVIDQKPKQLNATQRDILRNLACAAAAVMEKTRQVKHVLELKTTEQHYKTLIDSMYEGVVFQRADGTIVSCNKGAQQLLGLSYDEMVGRQSRDPRWQCVHEDGSDWPGQTHPAMVALHTGREVRDAVMGVYKPSGELTWILINARPLFESGQSQPVAVMTTFSDITERKRSEDALRRSESMFAALFNSAGTGMGMLTPQGVWLQANQAMQDFLGYSLDELQEMTAIDVTHPDEWALDALQVERLLSGELPLYQRVKRYAHKDGGVVWGLLSASVVRDRQGEPEFFVTQVVDVTARKRAEEALAASNALMDESQMVARVGGWSLDVTENILTWTAETYRIFELPVQDFEPTLESVGGYFAADSLVRMQAGMQLAIDQGQGYDLEVEAFTASGQRMDVRMTCSASMDNGKVVRLSGILQDITERKLAEHNLNEARAAAELAAQSKGQFLATMSHEIRTPMNAILGLLKLLGRTQLGATQFDYVNKIDGAAKSLLGLLNDILDFSKIDAGKMELDPRPFQFDKLLCDLAVVLSANVGAKPIEVLYEVDATIPPWLEADAMRLSQVLINLAGNAVKFTEKGQVLVSVRVVGIYAPGDTAVTLDFAVQDSGIGIAPENQAKIFSGFSQAESSTSRRFGGTGLGLAISQRLVALMGGEIVLASALGQGSTFSFRLRMPVAQAHDDAPQLAAFVPSAADNVRRVLLVDDNPLARTFMGQMMDSLGWQVDALESGPLALAHVAGLLGQQPFPYQCVVVDWQMSPMDGWEFVRQLQTHRPALGDAFPRVVMVSANTRDDWSQRTELEQSWLSGFLVKPVVAAQLRDAALGRDSGADAMRVARRSSKRQLAGMRILVVEDNAVNQQVAEELLSFEGAEVAIAADGQQGVNAVLAAQVPFDVVLMDVQMPVMDGYTATRVIRQELGMTQLPIIGLTANAMAMDRDACLAVGMTDHIGKPFDMRELVRVLLRVTAATFVPPLPVDASAPDTVLPPPVPGEVAPQEPVVFDLDGALERMGGMQSLYLEAAQDWLPNLHSVQEELGRLLASDDRVGTTRLLHTMKSNAATFGLMRLAAAFGRLEKMSKLPEGLDARGADLAALDALITEAKVVFVPALRRLEDSAL